MTIRAAVVAMACEFPGASSPEELWTTVLHGRRCFRKIPQERLITADYPDSGSDGIYAIEAGLLEGYEFDRAQFRVPNSAFQRTDMAHWLALDVASRAIASLSPDSIQDERDNIAVIVANTLTGEFSRAQALRYRWPYVARAMRAASTMKDADFDAFLAAAEIVYKGPLPAPDEDSLAGGLSNTIAGRIANHHGLRGGAHTVDGACASSLVAVTSACERLAAGDVGCVLVGAVDLSLDPFELVGFARNGALARSLMRVFDEDSDGFWPGEGCGFLMLATEALVERHGWPILGWVCGSSMSTDGAGALTRPSKEGQTLAATRAWTQAGLHPVTADYFEAHGTGTPTGDPIELEGLAALLASGTPEHPVPVGSIKANVGHTKAAAGMAGLLKALMICRERVIPPTTGCDRPLAWLHGAAGTKIAVQMQARAVMHDRPLRVGVNSFGFGGINCHVVLQGPDVSVIESLTFSEPPNESALPGELFQLAAASADALASSLQQLSRRAVSMARDQMPDLANAMEGGGAAAWRACVVATSPSELAENAAAAAASVGNKQEATRIIGEKFSWSAPAVRAPRIAYLFAGQGSSLQLQPARWAARFHWLTDAAHRTDNLRKGDLEDTAVVQPLLAEIALAGIEALSQLGIVSEVVMGHSFGELPALHCAGRLSEEALRELARWRGTYMREHAGPGLMVALRATKEIASGIASRYELEVACENGRTRHVLSGSPDAVQAAVAECQAAELAPVVLASSRAFHSRAMEEARTAFAVRTEAIGWLGSNKRVVSSITGQEMDASESVAELLADQLVRPVLFLQGLEALGEPDLAIEVGSGAVLAGLAEERFPGRTLSIDMFGSSPLPLLAAAGAAWVCGAAIERRALYARRSLRPCSIHGDRGFLVSPCGLKREEPLQPSSVVRQSEVQAPDATSLCVVPAGASSLETLKAVIAEQTGLPRDSLHDSLRLLADLHLNSIRARHVVAQCAQKLGIARLPFEVARLSNARIDEAAAHLESLRAKVVHEHAAIEGVAPWIRLHTHNWETASFPVNIPAAASRSRLIDPFGLLDQSCYPILGVGTTDGDSFLVLVLPSGRNAEIAGLLLDAVKQMTASPGCSGILVLEGAQTANAFMRSAALDLADRRFCVVEYELIDVACLKVALSEYASQGVGYSELRLRGQGCERRLVRVAKIPEQKQPNRIAPGAVLIVTGGASGIGKASAAAMAHAFCCRLALIGRSPPEMDTVDAALRELRAEGCDVNYFQADLGLPDQAAAAVAAISMTMGPVQAVLHAAGINRPIDVTKLEREELTSTISCKVDALRNLLEHLRPAQLKFVIGFGSIIGEFGLAGEAHYALANEWLGQQLAEFARERPECRTHHISWSAWRETGMAARLVGVLDDLEHKDSRAISTAEGTSMLLRFATGQCAGAVICSGRYGRRVSGADQRSVQSSRYLERLMVLYPGIELIADATICSDSDPYLLDHTPQGIILFPMACAIDAMVAAAKALIGERQLPVLRNFKVGEGISFAIGERIVVRTCALRANDGSVEVQLRADLTGYGIAHFSGTLSWTAAPSETAHAKLGRRMLPRADDLLYRGVCFHGPRFQQLGEVLSLSSTECQVTTGGKDRVSMYGPLLPTEHSGGSPLVRDSVMHALQLCVPHQVVLPVSVNTLSLCEFHPEETYRIAARQNSSDGNCYVFDIDVFNKENVVVESWRALKLTCAPPGPSEGRRLPLEPVLLESLAGRVAMDDLGAKPVRVRLYTGMPRHAATASACSDLAAHGEPVHQHMLSATHFDEYALVLASDDDRVVVDVQLDPHCDMEQWRLMLGEDRWLFSVKLVRLHGLSQTDAALCTWSLSECIIKLGVEGWPLAGAASTGRGRAAIGEMLRFDGEGVSCIVVLVQLAGKDVAAAMALAMASPLEIRQKLPNKAGPIEENA